MELTTFNRLQRLVKATEKLRAYQEDYYFHRVQSAKPKMRQAQREVDALIKNEKQFLKSNQMLLL